MGFVIQGLADAEELNVEVEILCVEERSVWVAALGADLEVIILVQEGSEDI